jgi:cytosine permease
MNRMFSFKVKEQDRRGWGAMAVITAGQLLCIPALMVGGILGEGLSLAGVVFCVAAGGLVLLFCACCTGMRSSASGLPAVVICAEGLGVRGVRLIPAVLITITGIGWFGVQAAICGSFFSVMAADVLGIAVPAWGATISWGLIMGFSALYGYRGLRYLYYIMAPVLFFVLIFTVIRVVFFSEAGPVLSAWRPVKPLSYITAISLVVGDWAMGAYVVGDYCRYAKKPRDAALGISTGLIFALPAAFLGGALLRIAAGNADITVILNGMGFPAVSLVFLIFASWMLNMMNAYSGGIAISVLLNLEEKRLKAGIAFTGLAGTVLGAAGILSRFTEFLSLLSSFVLPLIGVLIGVKIVSLLRRGRNKGDTPLIPGKPVGVFGTPVKQGFHIPGIIAYGCGALAAWLSTGVIPFFIPPLNGIMTAAIVYGIPDLVSGRRAEKANSNN